MQDAIEFEGWTATTRSGQATLCLEPFGFFGSASELLPKTQHWSAPSKLKVPEAYV